MSHALIAKEIFKGINTTLFLANQKNQIFSIDKNFKPVKRTSSLDEVPIMTTTEVAQHLFKEIQKIHSVEGINSIEKQGWKTLVINVKIYFQKNKATKTKAYKALLHLLCEKGSVTFSSQEALEYILNKKDEEILPSEWEQIKEAATLLELEKTTLETHFVATNLDYRQACYRKSVEKIIDDIIWPQRWEENGDFQMVASPNATLTSRLFLIRLNDFIKGPKQHLTKEELWELLELVKTKDTDLRTMVKQFLNSCYFRASVHSYTQFSKDIYKKNLKDCFPLLKIKSRVEAIVPDLVELLMNSARHHIRLRAGSKDGKEFDKKLILFDQEHFENKRKIFQDYTKNFSKRALIYQKCLSKLEAVCKKTGNKDFLMTTSFEESQESVPFSAKQFLSPLKDYKTVTIELDLDKWEREWKAKKVYEKKKEKKTASPVANPTTPLKLPSPPFDYNDWVKDWFDNPDKNLAHPKYQGKNLERIKRAHIFTPLIDHFVKAIGIKGTYRNSRKTYNSWTIGAEIEPLQGKKRPEYLTYGFDPETNILEHRSFTIAKQESEIHAFLQKSYSKANWPELNSQANQAALEELAPKLCKKYRASDKSHLERIEEYQLTFWDERLQSWIHLMNLNGAKALQSL